MNLLYAGAVLNDSTNAFWIRSRGGNALGCRKGQPCRFPDSHSKEVSE